MLTRIASGFIAANCFAPIKLIVDFVAGTTCMKKNEGERTVVVSAMISMVEVAVVVVVMVVVVEVVMEVAAAAEVLVVVAVLVARGWSGGSSQWDQWWR
jgi:hypothetical protein